MNLIGGFGLAITGVALFFNKVADQPAGIISAIVIFYILTLVSQRSDNNLI
jgi:hypothetical protein